MAEVSLVQCGANVSLWQVNGPSAWWHHKHTSVPKVQSTTAQKPTYHCLSVYKPALSGRLIGLPGKTLNEGLSLLLSVWLSIQHQWWTQPLFSNNNGSVLWKLPLAILYTLGCFCSIFYVFFLFNTVIKFVMKKHSANTLHLFTYYCFFMI